MNKYRNFIDQKKIRHYSYNIEIKYDVFFLYIRFTYMCLQGNRGNLHKYK
jgi:hypothetical protein